MIFCLVVFRLARIGINAPDIDEVFLQNEMGTADAPSNVRIEEARKRLDKIDQDTAELFNKYSERSFGPLHDFAIDFSHAMLKKMRDQACPIREQPEWGNEILTSGDNLFKISIISVEFTIYLYQKAKVAGNFVWIITINFQVNILIFVRRLYLIA
ncbi:putative c6 zinc finger domain-containing protein [Eutypa lata UCREL1]|uniref:Putative c6 zinc finger domain-containing protein n=1 Tax=Eutypa lata (strain UCR-EL1) TaxID=1287681 RepID=M7T5G5_EUTLA|nr:putative c6 zinc finger domain-containing protein [Eutypa lata UCREL1]